MLVQAESINALIARLSSSQCNSHDVQELFRLTHTIAGSAGTFDAPEYGRVAREMTELLRKYAETATIPEQIVLASIRDAFARLQTEGAKHRNQSAKS